MASNAVHKRSRKEGYGSMEVVLILVLIGVVLWATGHMVMH